MMPPLQDISPSPFSPPAGGGEIVESLKLQFVISSLQIIYM
jgi:hypothetical protein